MAITRKMMEGQAAHDARPREPAGKRVGIYAPYEIRLFTELSELRERIERLDEFLKSDNVASLRQSDRDLLVVQRAHMGAYAAVLHQRAALID
jgi:hypothetical protein